MAFLMVPERKKIVRYGVIAACGSVIPAMIAYLANLLNVWLMAGSMLLYFFVVIGVTVFAEERDLRKSRVYVSLIHPLLDVMVRCIKDRESCWLKDLELLDSCKGIPEFYEANNRIDRFGERFKVLLEWLCDGMEKRWPEAKFYSAFYGAEEIQGSTKLVLKCDTLDPYPERKKNMRTMLEIGFGVMGEALRSSNPVTAYSGDKAFENPSARGSDIKMIKSFPIYASRTGHNDDIRALGVLNVSCTERIDPEGNPELWAIFDHSINVIGALVSKWLVVEEFMKQMERKCSLCKANIFSGKQEISVKRQATDKDLTRDRLR